ncbi:MAG: glycerol-3-phosphate acyltransferase, partial [Chloroflexi bacterium]|nr:glycerol-3-phosphate acyltransferase [Chloroflexota bacterium]
MAALVVMSLISLVAGYLLGSIPIGLLLVRLSTGKDLRREHSGRTGATNAGRAAGAWVGAATMFGDGLKAAEAVWLARALTGGQPWVEVAAGIAAVLGHNYSLFLVERRDGKLHFRGGAGGAPTIGAAIGLWTPSALVTIPVGVGVLLLLGYASVATISGAAAATVVFLVRALLGAGPWPHVAFGP